VFKIDLIEVLANAMHSGRSWYSCYQIRLKIHSNPLENPINQNALHLPKPRIGSMYSIRT